MGSFLDLVCPHSSVTKIIRGVTYLTGGLPKSVITQRKNQGEGGKGSKKGEGERKTKTLPKSVKIIKTETHHHVENFPFSDDPTQV